jgi:hypothetical protein
MPNSPSTIDARPSTELLSNEIKFLIACCQTNLTEEDTEYILSYLNHQDLDTNTLIRLANQHGISPLVYKTLKSLKAEHLTLNAEILTELKAHYMGISQKNMLMSAELLRIMKLLEKNGIESLAFKGPSLSQMAYGDITLRQFGDLDILIKKKDRSKMMDLLIQENYIPEIDLGQGTKETFFNCVNVIGLYKKTTRILVEVHWELLSKNYAIDWKEESLWSKKEYIHINNKEISVLPTEQLLLYLCAHGSKHLFERLEWICDIDRAVKSSPCIDWEFLINEAEKLGVKRMLYLGLGLSQQFFSLELPEIIQKGIAQDKEIPKLISKVIEVNFKKTSQQGKSYSSFGLLWSMRENLSDQLRFAWRGLFAPKFDDFVFIQLPKHLAFLYPVVRPYRLLTKYFKHK